MSIEIPEQKLSKPQLYFPTVIIQGKPQPPRIWPLSLGGLPVANPGSSAQERCQCSSRSSAGAGVGHGSLK